MCYRKLELRLSLYYGTGRYPCPPPAPILIYMFCCLEQTLHIPCFLLKHLSLYMTRNWYGNTNILLIPFPCTICELDRVGLRQGQISRIESRVIGLHTSRASKRHILNKVDATNIQSSEAGDNQEGNDTYFCIPLVSSIPGPEQGIICPFRIISNPKALLAEINASRLQGSLESTIAFRNALALSTSLGSPATGTSTI
jgi:hypothetical protein